jgi:hypothetical protein
MKRLLIFFKGYLKLFKSPEPLTSIEVILPENTTSPIAIVTA